MDATKFVASDEDFMERLRYIQSTRPSDLVVVHYFINQSASCMKMVSVFQDLSFKFEHSGVQFLKVNGDICQRTIQIQGIRQMPTFVFYKNMDPVLVIEGAKPFELEAAIRQHIATKGDVQPMDDVGFTMGPGGRDDLYHFLDMNRCESLNTSELTPFSLFMQRKGKLQSDCDGQLILVYGFNQPVKVTYIKMKAPVDNGPAGFRIFTNQIASLDFDDAIHFASAQDILIRAEDLGRESTFQLNQTRFGNITNLHIFIPSNISNSDITEIDFISIHGEPLKPSKGIAGKTDQLVFLD